MTVALLFTLQRWAWSLEHLVSQLQANVEDSLKDLWDIKCTNIHFIGVPEREEKENT